MIRHFAVIVLILIVIKSTQSQNVQEKNTLRLPNNTKPISYNLDLTTNIHRGEFKFNGRVAITLKALEDTDRIIIHAYHLEDVKVSLIDQQSAVEYKNVSHIVDKIRQWIVVFSHPHPLQLKEGKEYLLTLSFYSYLSYDLKGFYASYYSDPNGTDIWTASSHFEPIFARKAFPCYDEPMMKAKFTISITHGSNYTALSNMPIDTKSTISNEGMITTKFKNSPLMSTYTIAFMVTNYESISVQKNNITHRIFSPLTAMSKGLNSLNTAAQILNAFEDYFEISYPLPKIDHISVPTHSSTAMENWGLIIYKHGYLLPFSKSSKLYNLQIVNLIAHEIAHQWLGNLVTPKWWSFTWLNEGISTFYAFKIVDMLYPELKSMEYGLFLEGADFWKDKQERPMTLYVETELDILHSFRKVFYFKGFKLMRMFEQVLGDATLKKAITRYLNKFQYATVEEDDLFESLQTAAIEDNVLIMKEEGAVRKIMSSWTHQGGIPCITVYREYENGTFTIYQDSTLNNLWWIPVTFTTASELNFDLTTTDFIFPNEYTLIVDPQLYNKTLLEEDWLILNKQQIGIYRVQYDQNNWNLIIEALKKDPKTIHSYNKVQLIRDAAFFEETSLLPSKTLYNLLSYLKDEDDTLPWHEALVVLNNIHKQFNETLGVHFFKYFARNITSRIYKKVGIEIGPNDSPITEEFRAKLFNFACDIGLENCSKIVEEKLKTFIFDKEIYDPYMKTSIFCEYLKSADDIQTKEFMRRLKLEKTPAFDEGKLNMIKLIECTKLFEFKVFLVEYMDISLHEIISSMRYD